MILDELAYKIYIDELAYKFGIKTNKYHISEFFITNKEYYQDYYNKANSIIRKEKLKGVNEI